MKFLPGIEYESFVDIVQGGKMLLRIWTRFSDGYDFATIWTREGVMRVSLCRILEGNFKGLPDDRTFPRWPQPMTAIVTSLLPSSRESITLVDLRHRFFVLLMMAGMV